MTAVTLEQAAAERFFLSASHFISYRSHAYDAGPLLPGRVPGLEAAYQRPGEGSGEGRGGRGASQSAVRHQPRQPHRAGER